MHNIEKRTSGYLLTFGGYIDAAEMEAWCHESEKTLALAVAPFGVVVDMRSLTPLPSEVQQIMVKGQKLYKAKGMQRSAVVVNNALTASQFKRLAKDSGIYAWERYIDASSTPNWSKVAVDWVKDEVDPDRK
jgi:hypothetical protein